MSEILGKKTVAVRKIVRPTATTLPLLLSDTLTICTPNSSLFQHLQ